MAVTITLTAGDQAIDQGVGYTVWGASYTNLASQYLYLGANRFAAPYSRGTFYIDGDTQVHLEWKAPPNTIQPTAALTQIAYVTFTPIPLWDSGTASAPKGLYYDRNIVTASGYYEGLAVGPHGNTIRFTYTVPAKRLGQLQGVLARVTRITAAAPVGKAYVNIYLPDIGNTPVALPEMLTNSVGDTQKDVLGAVGVLTAGQRLIGATGDSSTGGTVDYEAAVFTAEFDV